MQVYYLKFLKDARKSKKIYSNRFNGIEFIFGTRSSVETKIQRLEENAVYYLTDPFFTRGKKPKGCQVMYIKGFSRATVTKYENNYDVKVNEYYTTSDVLYGSECKPVIIKNTMIYELRSWYEEKSEKYDLVDNISKIQIKFFW